MSREFYGGAIKANLDPSFIDASTFRQIPDSQEVFVDDGSNVSVIIQVLERVPPSDAEEALKYHFDALAEDSEAEKSTVERVDLQNATTQAQSVGPLTLVGTQDVAKFNTAKVDSVKIFLGLYRLVAKPYDVVVTVNNPDRERDAFAESVYTALINSFAILDYGLFV